MPAERSKKARTPEERSIDPAAQAMLILADEQGIPTAFSRAEQMAPCPIGADGMCCRVCFMGPCRLVRDGQTGVCGATAGTITARNFARAVAAGARRRGGVAAGKIRGHVPWSPAADPGRSPEGSRRPDGRQKGMGVRNSEISSRSESWIRCPETCIRVSW